MVPPKLWYSIIYSRFFLLYHRFSCWHHRFSCWHHRFSCWHHSFSWWYSMLYTMWWFEHIINISYLVSAGGAPEHHCYPGVGQSTALLHQSHLPHCHWQSACLAEQQLLFLSATCCREESGNNERPVALFAGQACKFYNHGVRVCRLVRVSDSVGLWLGRSRELRRSAGNANAIRSTCNSLRGKPGKN